jgi:hypothetical protein
VVRTGYVVRNADGSHMSDSQARDTGAETDADRRILLMLSARGKGVATEQGGEVKDAVI